MSSRDLAANTQNQMLSEIFCPPIQTWVLGDSTAFKVTAVSSIIICPVAILLNILVIVITRKKRELKNNYSNILLASLAVADIVISAVSMPLTFTLDVLVLAKFTNTGTFCSIAFVNDTLLYIGSCSSVFHLTVIAWERFVAVKKWMDYKGIVTKNRVKKYAGIAWILAVLLPIPSSVMKIVGVQYSYLLVVDVICVVPGVACILLIGYFYIQVYLGVRRQELDKIREVRSLIKARRATKIAKRTAVLTVVVLISFVPSLVFLLFGEVFTALRRSSFFRWSMMLAQLNGLFDPVLYCYMDPRFRDAMLEMLRMKKPAPRVKVDIPQGGAVQSQEIKRMQRSKTYDSADSSHQSQPGDGVTRVRRMSAPPCHATHIVTIQVEVHQPKARIQVESGAATRQSCHDEDTNNQPEASEPQESLQPQVDPQASSSLQLPLGSKVRSRSLNELELPGFICRP